MLKEALGRESPDLLAERFAVPWQPPLSRWDEHLEREDPLHLGRERYDRERRAGAVCHLVLQDDRWPRLADLGPDDGVEVHQEDVAALGHSPSVSTPAHS